MRAKIHRLIHFSVSSVRVPTNKHKTQYLEKGFQNSPCSFLVTQKLIMKEAIRRYLPEVNNIRHLEHANFLYFKFLTQPTTASNMQVLD